MSLDLLTIARGFAVLGAGLGLLAIIGGVILVVAWWRERRDARPRTATRGTPSSPPSPHFTRHRLSSK